jgi:hypothetical protein
VYQLELFSPDEREQLRRDEQSLRARLDRIPTEIEEEVVTIRARYARTEPRLFPIAVTYLLPERIASMGRGG